MSSLLDVVTVCGLQQGVVVKHTAFSCLCAAFELEIGNQSPLWYVYIYMYIVQMYMFLYMCCVHTWIF